MSIEKVSEVLLQFVNDWRSIFQLFLELHHHLVDFLLVVSHVDDEEREVGHWVELLDSGRLQPEEQVLDLFLPLHDLSLGGLDDLPQVASIPSQAQRASCRLIKRGLVWNWVSLVASRLRRDFG